jgi:exodeoxyribonuclease VII small subunit
MNPMTKEKISYTEAYEELQQIVAEIESGDISVDELAEKVKRATALVKVCREKLARTGEDVNTILKELDGTGPA